MSEPDVRTLDPIGQSRVGQKTVRSDKSLSAGTATALPCTVNIHLFGLRVFYRPPGKAGLSRRNNYCPALGPERESSNKKEEIMPYEFAPMEGITGFRFRNIHHRMFPGIDKYYMPFMSPHTGGSLKNKEKSDIAPENNEGLPAVPQILTNQAESFIITARMLKDLGYSEVNLNLGCPSPTVVTKKKGAGFLGAPEELDHFLEEIFAALSGEIDISIKTRLGVSDEAEADRLFEIYGKYPLSELIVHARLQTDFYRRPVHEEVFQRIAEPYLSSGENDMADPGKRTCLTYNGSLYTAEACRSFLSRHPRVTSLMLGRGLLRDPALVRTLKGGPALTLSELRDYHDALYESYRSYFQGPAHLLGHMKELWTYFETVLTPCPRLIKEIRKSRTYEAYEGAVSRIFTESEILNEGNAEPASLTPEGGRFA